MTDSMKRLEDAIEGLRKDIAEFQDIVAARIYISDAAVLTKAPPEKCPCKKHRRYQAILKPTSECPECWAYYSKRHP